MAATTKSSGPCNERPVARAARREALLLSSICAGVSTTGYTPSTGRVSPFVRRNAIRATRAASTDRARSGGPLSNQRSAARTRSSKYRRDLGIFILYDVATLLGCRSALLTGVAG
jgi:hypothetical protein